MIYLVDLESVESRYTSEWKDHFPKALSRLGWGHPVTVIDGPEDIAACTTPGAFLNFSGTNIYKSVQVQKIAELFTKNRVTEDDHFVFADAWHPGIINLKYMAELLGVNVKIHALWHAGSYDPADFLGRLIGDAPWVRHTEKALFEAVDYNYFATDFHINMFIENLLEKDVREGRMNYMPTGKITRSGWPMEYISKSILPVPAERKENLVLFPHRIAPEKQVEIFKDLAQSFPDYEFVVCQEQNLTKEEYRSLLQRAKMVFSANLQETLGISCFEILAANGIPFVPDRLSYSEMYSENFKYPSEWTASYESYLHYKDEIEFSMRYMLDHYNTLDTQIAIRENFDTLQEEFFSGHNIYNNMKSKKGLYHG